jgi:solute carrier family 25 phosphate transporter 3
MIKGDNKNLKYFLNCGIGGSLACGGTHFAIVPIDIVKCRKQASPLLYKSTMDGFRTIFATEGLRGFTVGWIPTSIGYGV